MRSPCTASRSMVHLFDTDTPEAVARRRADLLADVGVTRDAQKTAAQIRREAAELLASGSVNYTPTERAWHVATLRAALGSPDVDWVVVERVVAGERASMNPDEQLEVARRLAPNGPTAVARALRLNNNVARRLHTYIETIELGAA